MSSQGLIPSQGYSLVFSFLSYSWKKFWENDYPVRAFSRIVCIKVSHIFFQQEDCIGVIYAIIPGTHGLKQRMHFTGISPPSARHPATFRAALVGNSSTHLAEVEPKDIAFRSDKQKSSISSFYTSQGHTSRILGIFCCFCPILTTAYCIQSLFSLSQHLVSGSCQLVCSTSAMWTICSSTLSHGGA